MWTTLRSEDVWGPCLYMYFSLALSLDIREGMFYWYTDSKGGPSFSQVFGLIYWPMLLLRYLTDKFFPSVALMTASYLISKISILVIVTIGSLSSFQSLRSRRERNYYVVLDNFYVTHNWVLLILFCTSKTHLCVMWRLIGTMNTWWSWTMQ